MTPTPIRNMNLTRLFPLCFLFISLIMGRSVQAQKSEQVQLNWSPVVSDYQGLKKLSFEGAHYFPEHKGLPSYFKRLTFSGVVATVAGEVYAKLSTDEAKAIQTELPVELLVQSIGDIEKKQNVGLLHILPFRKSSDGSFEKLISFQISYQAAPPISQKNTGTAAFTNQSVLQSGDWYKIGLTRDGIYKVTYSNLLSMGMDPATISLSTIRLFGNGGGMLPALNSATRKDDLQECPIEVNDLNQDGLFNGNDYFIFYGQGPDRWTYSTSEKQYLHNKNIYTDTTFYFITANVSGNPKRINKVQSQPSSPGDVTVTAFTDYAFYEKDEKNFIKSGREWYGETFDVILSQEFTFSFSNIIPGTARLKSSVASRTATDFFATSSFNVRYNNSTILTHTIANVSTSYTADFARPSIQNATFIANSNDITIDYTYIPYNATSTGYLDYVAVNVTRALSMAGNEMNFRFLDTANTGGNRRFEISNPSAGLKIWNVSDHNNVYEQEYINTNNKIEFTNSITSGSLSEFVAFNSNGYQSATFAGKVDNQNLHSLSNLDYIIITHPDFTSEAERLADFHSTKDNLRSAVVNVKQIFNEFSGGAQDAAGIRDFLRMLYERATTSTDIPRYVLLMGDGSYDLKERIANNTNYITTFQSNESLSLLSSYTSDDFYGCLDPNEGTFNSAELIDIGLGRFPVRTLEEAREMVDKVINYSTVGTINDQTFCAGSNSTRLGDWRNVLCFIADDQDNNLHQRQSERIVNIVQQNYPVYNVDKIVSDAYQQVSTPGGLRYPDVNDAITKRTEKGALLMNYTGHGGELGWAAEAILNNDMINSWRNTNNLPAFVTATCEFSRYDDPQRTSAGEFVLLNATGGGICLFTTVRLAFAIDNELINSDMMGHMFRPLNGEMPRAGDILRLSKRDNPGNRNITLLGDPALRLAYPKYNVTTTAIEETGTGNTLDTLSALSKVTVKGKVTDANGNALTNFNGVVYPTIYDKASKIYTVVNDQNGNDVSKPDSFNLRKNILYKGKASVVNGEFSCSFIVPKDISFQYGTGRLSYYAHNGEDDAQGYSENFQIGGSSANALNDAKGPEIKLFMNDENFIYGSITNSTPSIYAILFDSSGINTVGNGIGHDITAIVDGNPQQLFVLNDFYESDMDSYQQGRVRYRLDALDEGSHTLTFKAWDINNNSSETTTEFIVASSAGLALERVLNYPNPFTTRTNFMFEHNKPCTGMAIQVQIFTITGKLVKTIDAYQVCEGFRNTPLEWDGKDDFGDQLAKGVYIYRLRIRTAEGETAQKTERLVLLR